MSTYHPDDIAGRFNSENPHAIEQFYQLQIAQAPQEPWNYWCLIQVHLTHGQGLDAQKVFLQAIEALPNPSLEVVQKLHWRVIYAFLDTASYPNFHEELFNSVPVQFREHQTHLGLLQLWFAHDAASDDEAVVPLYDLYDGWWKKGPFVLKKPGLKKYAALYVTHIDENRDASAEFCASAGIVEVATGEIQFGWFYQKVQELTKFMPERKLRSNVNWFMEMGDYQDGKTILKAVPRKPFNREKWESSLGLDGLECGLDGLRFLRNWGAVR